MSSGPILFWAMTLLSVISYVFALLMYNTIGKVEDHKDVSWVQHHWGSVLRGIVSLLQLSTFDDVGHSWLMLLEGDGHKFEAQPYLFIVFAAVTTLCGIGILNLMI